MYIITESFPYISRCLNGEFTEAGPGGDGGVPAMSEAAAALGIAEQDLLDALGDIAPDLDAAAATLGISVEELQEVLPAPPGR